MPLGLNRTRGVRCFGAHGLTHLAVGPGLVGTGEECLASKSQAESTHGQGIAECHSIDGPHLVDVPRLDRRAVGTLPHRKVETLMSPGHLAGGHQSEPTTGTKSASARR